MKNMTTDELKDRLESGEKLSIIDIREANEFADWSIHGSKNIPMYNALNAGQVGIVEDRCKGLDNSAPVVAVCRMGNTSQLAAARLEAMGYEAFSLSGGIRGWSNAWSVAEVAVPTNAWRLAQVRRNGKGCLSYVLSSDGSACVVDPCVDEAVYMSIADREKLKITHVLETHVHADHISRARKLAQASGAALCIPRNERVKFAYEAIEDGQVLKVGRATVTVISTPGHTLESACFDVDGKVLLSGDTIFVDNIGRPDLEKGDAGAADGARLLYDSLHKSVLGRDDVLLVCPGHTGDAIGFDGVALAATLGEIRPKVAPLVSVGREDFAKTIVGMLGQKPPNFGRVLAVNEGRMDLGWLDPLELEAGPNRCAVKSD